MRRASLTLVALIAALLAVTGAGAAQAADLPGAVTTCGGLPAGMCLADPLFPGQPAAADLRATGSPEDDLASALDQLAAATSGGVATTALDFALGILEGSAGGVPADRVYRGIPLLNWRPAGKIADVAPGDRTVDVHEVRFGDHALLDTAMIRVPEGTEDQGYTIRWHVAELGTSFGGELSPTALHPGGTGGGIIAPRALTLGPLTTGTTARNRFHRDADVRRDLPEQTRLAEQVVEIPMPAPQATSVVLDPSRRPNHRSFAQLAPYSAGGLAEAQAALPSDDMAAAIAKLSLLAPEKQVWTALQAVDRAALAADDPGALAAATSAADGARPLVGAMRSRDTAPSGVPVPAGADVGVAWMNNEAYRSRTTIRMSAGASLDVALDNADGFERSVRVVELRGRRDRAGADDWGSYDHAVLETAALQSAGAQTLTVTPSEDAFALWVADPELGDQAGTVIELDRGPRRESLNLGPGFGQPLHGTTDAAGDVWVTAVGIDTLVRVSPRPALADSPRAFFPLPGGTHTVTTAGAALGPFDVSVDGHGIVWSTLSLGNAIARIDPAQAHDGTSDGIDRIPLAACDTSCRPPALPGPPQPFTRNPLQMETWLDGDGNTVIAFTELNSDKIGILRVSPSGTKLNEVHMPCGCTMPMGIAVDADGAIWFSEGLDNRVGRMRLDVTRPYSTSTVEVRHFNLPGGVEEFTPGRPLRTCPPDNRPSPSCLPNPVVTHLPHSLAIDRKGRVWWTGEASQELGYLDPERAAPNSTSGVRHWPLPFNDFRRRQNPADIGIDRANEVFVSDEYGDNIVGGAPQEGADVALAPAWRGFRPTARNSLTDAPFADADGALWFLEPGAAMITRIAGVTAGAPNPSVPAEVTADIAAGSVSGTGLREMSQIDVTVRRTLNGIPNSVATTAIGVPVSGGAFAVGGPGTPWTTSDGKPLRDDDVVTLTPRGTHPPAPFTLRVADLSAVLAADGSVTGRARTRGRPLSERVRLAAGAASVASDISPADGSFTAPAGSLDPQASPQRITFTTGSPSAVLRTVAPLGPLPAPAPQPGPGPQPGPAPQQPGTAGGPTPAAPGTPVSPAAPVATCRNRSWLQRTGIRRSFPLLALTGAQAEACLGAPTRRTAAARTWKDGTTARLRGGRVVSVTITGRGRRSAPDRVGVGSSEAAFTRALGPLAPTLAAGVSRAVLRSGTGFVDVRITFSAARATRIVATKVSAKAIDAFGRTIARPVR